MSPWKEAALNAYYWATSPWRWWRNVLAVWSERVPVAVLMYHRVADDAVTPWTVSTRMFCRQIRWLAERFDLVSLEEAQRRIRKGSNFQPTVAITFDDGYADNCRQAIPLLVKQRIPCTYFVVAHNVLAGEPFTHDLLRGVSSPPNTLEQLRAMADAGIEIGSHGYSHADLGQIHDRRLLEHEVVGSRDELERALGRPIRYFAFPFGQYDNLSRAAFAVAERAGYEAVCSAYGGLNFPGDDAFHLQRMGIDDDMIGLKNWITGDPRRMFTARFVYERGPAEPAACPSTFRRLKPVEMPPRDPLPAAPPAAPTDRSPRDDAPCPQARGGTASRPTVPPEAGPAGSPGDSAAPGETTPIGRAGEAWAGGLSSLSPLASRVDESLSQALPPRPAHG